MSDLEQLLYDHRQGALTCYDHDHAGYCCVCGEHDTDSYRSHLAAVLAEHFSDSIRPLELGQMIHGYASGIFGRDSYACRTIEAKGVDWFVTRNTNGEVELITSEDLRRIDPSYFDPDPDLCGC